MRKKTKLKTILIVGMLCTSILASLIVFSSCPGVPEIVHTIMLYLFSSYTGNVYTYDLQSNTSSEAPVFDYKTDAGDHAYFYNNMGYIASASFSAPQLITFNPNSSPPTPSVFSETWIPV